MKHLLIIFSITILMNLTSSAQEAAVPQAVTASKNFFYVNPMGIVANRMELALEHNFKNSNSVMIMGGMTHFKGQNQTKSGGDGELQYRINMNKHHADLVKKGSECFIFFAPYVRMEHLDISDKYNRTYETMDALVMQSSSKSSVVNSLSAGFLFGVRLSSTDHRFSVCMFAGGGMKGSSLVGDQKYAEIFRSGYSGVIPRAGLQVGISF